MLTQARLTEHFDKAIAFQPAAPIDIDTFRSHPFLKFYPILSYVELTLVEPRSPTGPSLDPTVQPRGVSIFNNSSVSSEIEKRSQSIRKVFWWLRKKNVQRILKLVVIDDDTFPCSDETIEDCLRGFDIRYLNWNKKDLCVESLRAARLSNIKELWLSWSGRNSVLYSWSCQKYGLPTLGKVSHC
jgi:hypothetical protein